VTLTGWQATRWMHVKGFRDKGIAFENYQIFGAGEERNDHTLS
jgi:hypothetical protein